MHNPLLWLISNHVFQPLVSNCPSSIAYWYRWVIIATPLTSHDTSVGAWPSLAIISFSINNSSKNIFTAIIRNNSALAAWDLELTRQTILLIMFMQHIILLWQHSCTLGHYCYLSCARTWILQICLPAHCSFKLFAELLVFPVETHDIWDNKRVRIVSKLKKQNPIFILYNDNTTNDLIYNAKLHILLLFMSQYKTHEISWYTSRTKII